MSAPLQQSNTPRIAVFGANGQVGWELQRALAPFAQVLATDHDSVDLSQPEAIHAWLNAQQPDVIINAAAYTAVDKAESEAGLCRAINATAPAVMAQWAQQHGVRLVHYSTDYVFDGSKPAPYVESDATAPLNEYGRSKREGELAIANSGCDYWIFRTSWVYGARGANFLLTMLKLASQREQLNIVSDQIGAPTWCRRLAQHTAQAVHGALHGQPFANSSSNGIYHLVAGNHTSWHGFAEAIFSHHAAAGHKVPSCTPIPTEAYPTPAQRPRNSRLDTTLFQHTFGQQPATWQDDLAECMRELHALHAQSR